ncbi:hypothetical protein BDK51DRAFT_38474, partial [Blyttiomyces helicus]
MSRSIEIIKLLAKETLSGDEIDIIWTPIATNQHRSVIHGVYSIVGQLPGSPPLLRPEECNNFFEKIRNIPHSQLDPQAVALMRNFTAPLCIAQGYGDVAQRVGDYLWELLQDETEVDSVVAEDAYRALNYLTDRSVLSNAACDALLNRCFENLMKGTSVPYSLQFLRLLLGKARANIDNAKVALLSRLFYEDIVRYKIVARKAWNAARLESKDASSLDFKSTIVVGKHSHATHFRTRLEFLSTLHTLGFAIAQNEAELDTLWQEFIIDPFLPDEREDALQAFVTLLENESFVARIYYEKLSCLDTRQITEAAFAFIKQFYHRLNTPDNSNGVREIVDDPVGIDLLWDVALHASNDAVGRTAIRFLVRVYAE